MKNEKSNKIISPWIWGEHSVLGCLEESPELIEELFFFPGKHDQIKSLAKDMGVRHQSLKVFPSVVREKRHQGVIAKIKKFPVFSWDRYRDEYFDDEIQNCHQWAILDRIQDPQNFGAIVRSAAAFGVKTLFVPTREQCPITGVVAQVSAGNLFRVKIVESNSLKKVILFMQEQMKDLEVLALDQNGEQSLKLGMSSKSPKLWLLGAEQKGIRPSLKELSTHTCAIPMETGVESLNVSNSAAIAFFAGYNS